jgi:hypothetical protein
MLVEGGVPASSSHLRPRHCYCSSAAAGNRLLQETLCDPPTPSRIPVNRDEKPTNEHCDEGEPGNDGLQGSPSGLEVGRDDR